MVGMVNVGGAPQGALAAGAASGAWEKRKGNPDDSWKR